MKMPEVVLASSSPRRLEILQRLGFKVAVRVSEVDEAIDAKMIADGKYGEIVRLLALKKGEAAADKFGIDERAIIAADTVVVMDGRILGKPADENDAFNMLKKLSGAAHEVYSGIVVIKKKQTLSDYVCTKVRFRELTDVEIADYIKTGEPGDKAGAYGIQGLGGLFVEGIKGDYYNVVGLPVCKMWTMLNTMK